jgi:hypothetical protein
MRILKRELFYPKRGLATDNPAVVGVVTSSKKETPLACEAWGLSLLRLLDDSIKQFRGASVVYDSKNSSSSFLM